MFKSLNMKSNNVYLLAWVLTDLGLQKQGNYSHAYKYACAHRAQNGVRDWKRRSANLDQGTCSPCADEENSGIWNSAFLTWPSSGCYADLFAKVRRLELFSVYKYGIQVFIGTLALSPIKTRLDFDYLSLEGHNPGYKHWSDNIVHTSGNQWKQKLEDGELKAQNLSKVFSSQQQKLRPHTDCKGYTEHRKCSPTCLLHLRKIYVFFFFNKNIIFYNFNNFHNAVYDHFTS